MLILSTGALLNIIINYYLIPVLGIEGASLATLMGYVVSEIICVVVLCKMKLMVVSKRFVSAVIATVGFMILWRIIFHDKIIAALMLTGIQAFLYRSDLLKLTGMFKKKMSHG